MMILAAVHGSKDSTFYHHLSIMFACKFQPVSRAQSGLPRKQKRDQARQSPILINYHSATAKDHAMVERLVKEVSHAILVATWLNMFTWCLSFEVHWRCWRFVKKMHSMKFNAMFFGWEHFILVAGHPCTGATLVVWCGNCVCVKIFYGFLVHSCVCRVWSLDRDFSLRLFRAPDWPCTGANTLLLDCAQPAGASNMCHESHESLHQALSAVSLGLGVGLVLRPACHGCGRPSKGTLVMLWWVFLVACNRFFQVLLAPVPVHCFVSAHTDTVL